METEKIDLTWITSIVKEKYKYYGFEDNENFDWDVPFMENPKGDYIIGGKSWMSINWFIKNLNTVFINYLNDLDMMPLEIVKEKVLPLYEMQINSFNEWDLRKGEYVEYKKNHKQLGELLSSLTPDSFYELFRLKHLFLLSCFIKFYKILLDNYLHQEKHYTAERIIIKKKQPKASVIMKVFSLIDEAKGITKNECKEMLIDEKVEFIRNWINENLGYNYTKASTLKKEQYSIDGYNLEVENILKEKGFTQIARIYKLHQKSN